MFSQVRSHTQHEISNKAKLGFMVDPKRFNVALTRAEALLIVVGDPYILYQVCPIGGIISVGVFILAILTLTKKFAPFCLTLVSVKNILINKYKKPTALDTNKLSIKFTVRPQYDGFLQDREVCCFKKLDCIHKSAYYK